MRLIPIGLTLLAMIASGCSNSGSRPSAPSAGPADPELQAKTEEATKKNPALIGNLTD